jgi:hypothetical protein
MSKVQSEGASFRVSTLSLKSIRWGFEDGFYGVDEVVSRYREWLDWIFYIICCRFNYSKGDYEYVFFRGLKRGDKRYGVIVCRRFERLARFGRDLVYFSVGSHGHVQGSGLHFVLEYDSNVVGLSEAWLRVGVDFNRFMSRIRKLFGSVSIVRVWEGHDSGYPHIHILLIFHDHVFSGYSSRRRGRLIYRVFGSDYSMLKCCWIHGYSDVTMIDSFGGGVRYLGKYLSKSTSVDLAGVKGVRTLAMCWIYHKRSFSISGSLFCVGGEESEANRAARHDEILPNGNSNSFWNSERKDSDSRNSEVFLVKVGTDLYGNFIFEQVDRWRLFGFCVRDSVLWDDWCRHFVRIQDLVCVVENEFDIRHSRYDVVVSRNVDFVDDSLRCLDDF